MNQMLVVAALIVIASTGCGPEMSSDTPTVAVTLPPGDVSAGRQAFLDLKCTACRGNKGNDPRERRTTLMTLARQESLNESPYHLRKDSVAASFPREIGGLSK